MDMRWWECGCWILHKRAWPPHTELQCSILAHEENQAPLNDYPFATLEYMVKADRPSILCADIWNSTEECVAYNSEHLGLGANLCQTTFEKDGEALTFRFSSAGDLLVEGSVNVPARQPLSAVWTMMRQFGFSTFFKVAAADYSQVDVINRCGDVIPTNARASAFTKAETAIATPFNPATDRIAFGNIPFANIDFRPQVVQYFEGFKFVYLDPQVDG